MLFFKKYQTTLLRVLGIILLFAALGAHYSMPAPQMSENEKAAMRVARLEAKTAQRVVSAQSAHQSYMSKYEKYKAKQEEYFTFIFMILGLLFFISSFIKK